MKTVMYNCQVLYYSRKFVYNLIVFQLFINWCLHLGNKNYHDNWQS